MKRFTIALSVAGHESSICILEDGDIILFLQEERVTKIKKDSLFPLKVLEKIKEYTNHIDHLLLVNFELQSNVEYVKNYLKKQNITFDKFTYDVPGDYHHLAHASSAFYSSGFEEAICLVIDGSGGTYRIKEHPYIEAIETTSIFSAKYPAQFDLKFKNLIFSPHVRTQYFHEDKKYIEDYLNCIVNVSHHLDVGALYSATSKHLGFGYLNEGKTMGLSSFGKENSDIPNILCKNTILSNMNLYRSDRVIDIDVYPKLKNLTFQEKADLAYATQKASEKIILERVKFIASNYNCKNIVFSGGCSLNILANSKVKESFPDINFFVDPIATDASQSLGMAKYAFHFETNDVKIRKVNSMYLGPEYDINKIHKEVNDFLQK